MAGAVATITLTTPVNGAVADGANSNSVQAVVSDSAAAMWSPVQRWSLAPPMPQHKLPQ
ncbi:hypothetical protein [Yersinia pestis]|uniref:hypothetical protein n=1 Tax=Yersinia pestis TaxID=632 RepID=UPI0039903D0F